MVGVYQRKVATKGPSESVPSGDVEELKAELAKTQRQLRTLARETGHLAQVEHAGLAEGSAATVDPKKFGNTEDLKHGLTNYYIEKPFRELEEEMKEEGGELRLPNSIYTVAICAGFFCDGNVWDAIEKHTQKMAALATFGLVGKADEEEAASRHNNAQADAYGPWDILAGTLKNIWLMFVNAFVLLWFHYFLTFCVLYFLMAHPYETDPIQYNGTGFADAWSTHFAQGECPSNIWIRTLCASLFACFVYFDMLQSKDVLLWLYWAPYCKRAIAEGKTESFFFPDELKIRIIPSPFTGRGGDVAEREIESRIPGLYRIFMVIIVVIPKIIIAIALLFFGGKLVLRSDDSAEVIMNSLAAYFVAEMDEYVYQYLCPSAIQTVLEDEESFPPLNKKIPAIDILPDPRSEKDKYDERMRLVNDAVSKFNEFDTNGDGELGEEELDMFFTDCGITLSTPQVRQVIAYCDADRNGHVSLKELKWLLTCQDDISGDLEFNDPPDVKRWLQKEFMPRDPEDSRATAFVVGLIKSIAPVVRIMLILLLTLMLVATYCDDMNPMDSLRGRVATVTGTPDCTFTAAAALVEDAACATATADQATCEAAGHCTWTAADATATPATVDTCATTVPLATCETTVVDTCATATADQVTCEAAGHCTWTAADATATPATVDTCLTAVITACASEFTGELACGAVSRP